MSSRTSTLHRMTTLLVAGAMSSGCSRDAPVVGLETGPDAAIVIPVAEAIQAKVSNADAADPLDDVLTRLVPSLGPRGRPLRDALLRLQEQRSDATAWTDVQRVIEALSATLPEEYRPDLDALRLELGIIS
jgi:hypothetical protein